MAIQLSATAQAYLSEQAIEPNIVLEIKGLPLIFGAQAVFEALRIGEFFIGDGSKIGGVLKAENSRDWIMLNGTTNNISQQINIDRAEGSSITSFKISLIDKNSELTRILSPGQTLSDPLGVEATVYWMPAQASFPRDAAVLFIGIIDNLQFKQGSVVLNVAHPDQLKRQDILPKATTKLTQELLVGETSALVETTLGFIESQDALTQYVRIDDEIMRVDAQASTEFTALLRGQLGTIEADHDLDADVESFYALEGTAFDLALKILLSGGDLVFEERPAPRFVQIDSSTSINNAIFFEEFNIQESLGLVIGDQVEIVSSVSNNGTYQIVGFGQSSLGSYIITDGIIVPEIDSPAVARFTSRYNVLNFGCNLKPYQVDIAQFERLQTLISSSLSELQIYIKDTQNASDFLDKELYFPAGIYSVPRKGRISCNVTTPPIASADTVTLDASNITNGEALSIERTTNQRFYNAVVYKYGVDSISDRFLSARIRQSSFSTNRIKIGNKYLTIESNGLRDNPATQQAIDIQSRRFLDRYQYGAEKITVQTNFKTGFGVEVGDTVILEGAELKLADTRNGTRDFDPRIMEVTNKSINLKTGEVKLEVTDTGYSTQARYGTWAPSSILDVDSTGTNLRLKRSYSTATNANEAEKWRDYVGQKIIVRTENWASFEETTIVGIVASRPNEILVSPAITNAFEDYVVDVPIYDTTSAREGRLYKALHCSWTKADEITDVIGPTQFEVADPSLYSVGLEIRFRDELYSRFSDVTVLSISGNIITINREPDFGFVVGDLIDFVEFPDGGNYYAFF